MHILGDVSETLNFFYIIHSYIFHHYVAMYVYRDINDMYHQLDVNLSKLIIRNQTKGVRLYLEKCTKRTTAAAGHCCDYQRSE